uniref:Protein phosphatase 2C 40 n=1 Tax=Solanum tuberosum TaxID=4113 RepID=M1A077_SOLTU
MKLTKLFFRLTKLIDESMLLRYVCSFPGLSPLLSHHHDISSSSQLVCSSTLPY